jgi:hypothetical protein
MENIYKINAGDFTESELDLIIIAVYHLHTVSKKTKEMDDYVEDCENLIDKIMGRL